MPGRRVCLEHHDGSNGLLTTQAQRIIKNPSELRGDKKDFDPPPSAPISYISAAAGNVTQLSGWVVYLPFQGEIGLSDPDDGLHRHVRNAFGI